MYNFVPKGFRFGTAVLGEKKWISKDLDITDIASTFAPYDEREMEAFPVSRLISSKSRNTNVPGVMDPYRYENLAEIGLR